VDREFAEKQFQSNSHRVRLYQVHCSDYRRSICDTADDSSGVIVNCVNVRANVQ
jgi:hypothetical protein